MKLWVVATSAVAIAGAVGVAGLLAVGAQANADSSTAALALAERTSPKPPASARAAVSTTPAASPPSAASAEVPAPVSLEALPRVVTFRQTNTYNGAIVYVPEGCRETYDLILHFHGAHPYVRDLVEKANMNAVVAVFNAGNGAEKYSQAYGAGGTLSSLLRQIDMATAPLCPGAKLGRVALMAWSAGYAATEKLLSREEDRQRVDAVLLADGLHAGFTDRWKRLFAPNALQAFRDFGELAKEGKKLFAVTHSSIMTDGYGSTTECSRLLLKALNVPCNGELVSGKSGDFSIEGFTGDDKAAHIVQFRQMDTTLLAKLRARWLEATSANSGSPRAP
ncbi:MAG: hypothetical protein ABUL60_08345 [Myxococcales bacterium]